MEIKKWDSLILLSLLGSCDMLFYVYPLSLISLFLFSGVGLLVISEIDVAAIDRSSPGTQPSSLGEMNLCHF